MIICLRRGADLHMAELMPLPLTVSCSSKSRMVLPFWYRLTQVAPDKGLLNGCCCCCNRLDDAIPVTQQTVPKYWDNSKYWLHPFLVNQLICEERDTVGSVAFMLVPLCKYPVDTSRQLWPNYEYWLFPLRKSFLVDGIQRKHLLSTIWLTVQLLRLHDSAYIIHVNMRHKLQSGPTVYML